MKAVDEESRDKSRYLYIQGSPRDSIPKESLLMEENIVSITKLSLGRSCAIPLQTAVVISMSLLI